MDEHTTATTAGTDSGTAMLELEDVTVRFGGINALDSVALTVGRDTVCGLIGPNGAGKTTLFDVISGVRRPTRGRVTLDGVDVSSLGVARRAHRGVRRTFQRVQTFGWLTVEDNVLTALEWRGGGGGFVADVLGSPTRARRERERRARAERALELCGLVDVRAEYAGSLPIGIARMVELARATVDPPKLLLLDEPASGLDQTEAERLGAHIRAVRAETGCAVLLVEHNAGFVMEHSDRVVVLNLGRVLADGSPDEIQANPDVRTAYLGEVHPIAEPATGDGVDNDDTNESHESPAR
jgi:branched-chain amino acid transport system ATP-binding protein